MKKLILGILSIVLILFVSGCQNILPNPPKVVIDSSMPTITSIRTLSDINKIALEWEPIYNDSIKGYYIYRSNPLKNDGKLKRIAIINDKYVSHFVDTNLIPNQVYYYRMSTYSNNNIESRPSEVVKAKTLPLLPSVSYIRAISGLPHRIKIIWRPDPNQRVAKYIIQRNNLTNLKWRTIAVVDGRLNAEYIDKNLPDDKTFKYRIKVETYDDIISLPSVVVEASTKPLPPVVQNVKASRNLPKIINITWNRVNQKDISYYNVYRAITPYLFYTCIAKTADNKFEDIINKDGVARYYKVTAVDEQGLESPKQENPVMGTTLSKPLPPVLTNVTLVGDGVKITWKPADNRARKYIIIKKFTKDFSEKTIKYVNISNLVYIDKNIIPGKEYKYCVQAVDKNGIVSNPTDYISIRIPKDSNQ